MLLAALIAIALPALPAAARASLTRQVDAMVTAGIREQRYPGAVVVMGRGRRTLLRRSYGTQTYEPRAPRMRTNTLFDMASLTKVVATTPAAMLLVQDGTLDLDQPVARYLPEFAARGKEGVTLRHLATHVSGLKAYESFSVVEKGRRPDETTDAALLRRYADLPLSYPTGTKMVYSCLNMQTLSGLLQRVADEDTESLLRRRLWGPLGMRDTTYLPTPSQVRRAAPTAATADGKPVRGVIHDPLARYHTAERTCPGNAGLFSTGPDLERFVRMMLADGMAGRRVILRPETARLAFTVSTPTAITSPRSVGWAVYTKPPYADGADGDPAQASIGHTGYTGTSIWMDHATGAYVIFLTNRVMPSPATKGGEGAGIEGIRAGLIKALKDALATEPRPRA